MVNGYNEKDWENAVDLEEALPLYLDKAKDAVFCAHNVNFDFPFIYNACVNTGLANTMDYHTIDIPTLIWLKYRNSELDRVNLSKVAQFLGIEPEPAVHRAINGAMLAYKVLHKLANE